MIDLEQQNHARHARPSTTTVRYGVPCALHTVRQEYDQENQNDYY
jgi:hypothetical protein